MTSFLVRGHAGEGVLLLISDQAGARQSWTWPLTAAQARDLRDALTLAIAPSTAEPTLGCRIRPGRKACRGCGAAAGEAHGPTCPDILPRPPAYELIPELDRRLGPPERRLAAGALVRDVAGELLELMPPKRDDENRCPLVIDAAAAQAAVDAWLEPPTPEEKAAGERTSCPRCGMRSPLHAIGCATVTEDERPRRRFGEG